MNKLGLSLMLAASALAVHADDIGVPGRDAGKLESTIAAKLKREVGFKNLTGFHVDWTPSSLKCLYAETPMDPNAELGVCIVNASAFQVEGKAAIIKRVGGYSISIIYAEVE